MEIKKITKACFEEGQETAHARGLTQWDQGQYLEISGLNISNEIVEVHFSLDEYNGKAERMLGEVIDGVIHTKIPQFIMEGPEYCCGTSYNAYAWVYVSYEESAETIRKIELEIEGRSKPDEYVKPEELSFLQQLENYISRKLDKSGHAPNMYLGTDENGNVVTKDAPEGGEVSDEQIAGAVEEYLTENPIKVDVPTKTSDLVNDSGFVESPTTAEVGQMLVVKAVDENGVPTEWKVSNVASGGVTQTQAKALDDMFKKCAFTGEVSSEYEAFKIAFGLTDSGEVEPDEPIEPDTPTEPDEPTITLLSISATYTGGNVVVGTSVNSLTGITVKATYSDGSTKNVTGYTLSGTIAEGNNTITVSYGGKTSTFTVVGIAVEFVETTPVVEYENKGIRTDGTTCDKDGWGITKFYPTTATNFTYYYTNEAGIESPTSSSNKTMGFSEETELDGTGKAGYFSPNFGVEKTGIFSTTPTGLRATVVIAEVDNYYLYETQTGNIIFAGKNTKYYGMSNISEYTGE